MLSKLPKETVYPRVCGGTVKTADDHAVDAGLSPRVRGNQLRYQDALHSTRSIPACAGEPSTVLSKLPKETVYPRVCGGTHLV